MRDKNRQNVTLAYDGTNPQPLLVDPVTGRLLVDLVADSVTANGARAKIDQNKKHVELVVDANGVINPLTVDPSTNALLVDLS